MQDFFEGSSITPSYIRRSRRTSSRGSADILSQEEQRKTCNGIQNALTPFGSCHFMSNKKVQRRSGEKPLGNIAEFPVDFLRQSWRPAPLNKKSDTYPDFGFYSKLSGLKVGQRTYIRTIYGQGGSNLLSRLIPGEGSLIRPSYKEKWRLV